MKTWSRETQKNSKRSLRICPKLITSTLADTITRAMEASMSTRRSSCAPAVKMRLSFRWCQLLQAHFPNRSLQSSQGTATPLEKYLTYRYYVWLQSVKCIYPMVSSLIEKSPKCPRILVIMMHDIYQPTVVSDTFKYLSFFWAGSIEGCPFRPYGKCLLLFNV